MEKNMLAIERQIIIAVAAERGRADKVHPLFSNPTHGSGVIREEVEEATEEVRSMLDNFQCHWNAVKSDNEEEALKQAKQTKRHAIKAACELVQVIAMCDKYEDSNKRGFWRDIAKEPDCKTDYLRNKIQTICPNCSHGVNKGEKYCNQCGQMLDWSKL